MAEQVLMPQLGESVTEGTIGQWLKKAGDSVEQYESLLEVLTDKVNAEVPAPFAGTITKILVEEGQTVPVGTPICEMDVVGEAPAPQAEALAQDQPAAKASEPVSADTEKPSAVAEERISTGRGRYSPAVRRLAQDAGIDPGRLTGTGAGGRVTRKDVLQASRQPAPAPAPAPKEVAASVAGAPAVVRPEDRIEPLSSIRKVIAERMMRSKLTVPHAWIMVEVDVTGLVALRSRAKAGFEKQHGIRLTYVPFMMRAAVEGLRAVPIVNAQWNGDAIVYKQAINLGMATATERGLVVPVIHHADERNIVGLAKATQELAVKARNGQLTMEDISGGTFTVDNTGAVGTNLTYAVINAPEAAIMTVESVVKRPVVVDDAIAIRSMVNLCLSFDHRVIDGAEAAQFLQVVKRHLEALTVDSSVY